MTRYELTITISRSIMCCRVTIELLCVMIHRSRFLFHLASSPISVSVRSTPTIISFIPQIYKGTIRRTCRKGNIHSYCICLHKFNMSNRELNIKKINLAEKIKLSPPTSRITRVKSSILLQSRSKKVSLPQTSFLMPDTLYTSFSQQNMRSYQSLHPKRSLLQSPIKLYKNNYQCFPKRSLLTKPHIIHNTAITINLFDKKIIANEQKISILAQSLYKQLSESRANPTNHDKNYASQGQRKPRVSTRIESAPFKRQQSIKFTPWDHEQGRQDYNK